MFSIIFNMKVCCMVSLASPHQGDSNEYTQYTIFNIKKNKTLNCFLLCYSMTYRDFLVKSKLIISLFQIVKLSL